MCWYADCQAYHPISDGCDLTQVGFEFSNDDTAGNRYYQYSGKFYSADAAVFFENEAKAACPNAFVSCTTVEAPCEFCAGGCGWHWNWPVANGGWQWYSGDCDPKTEKSAECGCLPPTEPGWFDGQSENSFCEDVPNPLP